MLEKFTSSKYTFVVAKPLELNVYLLDVTCQPVITYLLTYLLTPWSTVLLEKLTSTLCR